MIEDWLFYIQQIVEPMDYDDSVKNDKDFDVSLKNYDYTEKNTFPAFYFSCMFSPALHWYHVFPHFVPFSCFIARNIITFFRALCISCMIPALR